MRHPGPQGRLGIWEEVGVSGGGQVQNSMWSVREKGLVRGKEEKVDTQLGSHGHSSGQGCASQVS